MGFGIEWGQLLFEVPVYRMSKAAWYNEVNESVQQFEQLSSHTDPIKRHDHALTLAALDRATNHQHIIKSSHGCASCAMDLAPS
jgi:hypothetical protein